MKTKTAFFLVLTLLSGLAACGGGEGGGDYAGARRGWADDDSDADEEYTHGGYGGG